MSISSEISRISGNVSDALTAISNKGVVVPSGSNSDDLADLISQITGGGTGATTVVTTQDSHGGDIVTITTGIDISNDTVAADKLLYGYTAHNSLGQAITGTYVPSGGASVTQDANGYLVIGSGGSGGGGYSVYDYFYGAPSGEVTIVAEADLPINGAVAGRHNITKLTIDLTGGYKLGRNSSNYGYNFITNSIPKYHIIGGTNVPEYCFYNNTSGSVVIVIRGQSSGFRQNAFRTSTAITTLDITTGGGDIGSNCFYNLSNLGTLIIRNTSIFGLNSTNAFTGTKFKSGGTGGTIYIPKSLYDHLGDGTSNDYKAATNWVTVDGWGTITWEKIEGSQYESYYADGTPVPTT